MILTGIVVDTVIGLFKGFPQDEVVDTLLTILIVQGHGESILTNNGRRFYRRLIRNIKGGICLEQIKVEGLVRLRNSGPIAGEDLAAVDNCIHRLCSIGIFDLKLHHIALSCSKIRAALNAVAGNRSQIAIGMGKLNSDNIYGVIIGNTIQFVLAGLRIEHCLSRYDLLNIVVIGCVCIIVA